MKLHKQNDAHDWMQYAISVEFLLILICTIEIGSQQYLATIYNNMNKMEAKVWDLERQLRDKESQIALATDDKDFTLRDWMKNKNKKKRHPPWGDLPVPFFSNN